MSNMLDKTSSLVLRRAIVLLLCVGLLLFLVVPTGVASNEDIVPDPAIDILPPTVTATSPEAGAVGVAIGANIVATFSEAMDPDTITTATFTLWKERQVMPALIPIPGVVSYDANTKKATFNPVAALDYNAKYSATVTTEVRDVAGNKMAANHTWTFRTTKFIPVTGVTLNKDTLLLTAGGAPAMLVATVTPVEATNKTVFWSSSNPAVVTVTGNGVVIPITAGSAIVTVTTADGGHTANCLVIVNPSPWPPDTRVIHLTVGEQEASVNGQPYFLDAAPFIRPEVGRTLVPLRFISEALGAQVDWHAETRQVEIQDDGTKIVLTIGSVYVLVDGVVTTIDCPAEILPPGRTFVPLRFISETLGAHVHYDVPTKRITIIRTI